MRSEPLTRLHGGDGRRTSPCYMLHQGESCFWSRPVGCRSSRQRRPVPGWRRRVCSVVGSSSACCVRDAGCSSWCHVRASAGRQDLRPAQRGHCLYLESRAQVLSHTRGDAVRNLGRLRGMTCSGLNHDVGPRCCCCSSVDAAFADRAGFKAHIGNPPAPGRYQLLRSGDLL